MLCPHCGQAHPAIAVFCPTTGQTLPRPRAPRLARFALVGMIGVLAICAGSALLIGFPNPLRPTDDRSSDAPPIIADAALSTQLASIDLATLTQPPTATIVASHTSHPTHTLFYTSTPFESPSSTSSPTRSATPTLKTTFIEVGDLLYIGPGRAFPVVRFLQQGTTVQLLERTKDSAWIRVRSPDLNLEGWIHFAVLPTSSEFDTLPTAMALPQIPTAAETLTPTPKAATVPPPVLPGGAVIVSCNPSGGTVFVRNVRAWFIERWTPQTKQTIPQTGPNYMAPNERALFLSSERNDNTWHEFCRGTQWRDSP